MLEDTTYQSSYRLVLSAQREKYLVTYDYIRASLNRFLSKSHSSIEEAFYVTTVWAFVEMERR